MKTDAKSTPEPSGFIAWFEQFLRSELAPYPGRGVVVARTVIAATITMLLIMTFRVTGGRSERCTRFSSPGRVFALPFGPESPSQSAMWLP